MRISLAIAVAMTVIACAAPRTGTPAPTTGSPPATTGERATAAAATSGPTPSATPTPAQRPDRYVAIGASDTVGVGAADPRTARGPPASRRGSPQAPPTRISACPGRWRRRPGPSSCSPRWMMSTGTVAADGFHPSDGGYQLIADRFLDAMRAAGIVR